MPRKAAPRKTPKKTAAKRSSAKRPAGKKAGAKKPRAKASPSLDGRADVARWIAGVADWRGSTLAKLRALIREAVPDVEEDIKWRKPSNPDGVPVWSSEGILCTGGVYKDKVKLTFGHGAALRDPKRVFNASLDAGSFRALDLHEGDAVDEAAFRDLVRQAAAHNAKMRASRG